MSTASSAGVGLGSGVAGGNIKGKFDDCIPQRVDAVSVMTNDNTRKAWEFMYAKAGLASGGEEKKRQLRCAVYCYLAINGTSPVGTYDGEIVSGSGNRMRASEIPAATGRQEVRRFMRANTAESIDFFRESGVLEILPAVVSKCELMSVRLSEAIAFCDWLDGAPGLTPAEREVSARVKIFGLGRSRGARGGKPLEALRDERLEESIERTQIMPPSSGW